MDKNNNSGKTSPDSGGGASSNSVKVNNKKGRLSPPSSSTQPSTVKNTQQVASASLRQAPIKKKTKKGAATSGKASATGGITKLMDIQVSGATESKPPAIPSLLSMSVPSDRKYMEHQEAKNKQDVSASRIDDELKRNHVFKSKKANKYRCNLCNYYCNSLDVALKHTLGDIHKNNIQGFELEQRVRALHMPSQEKLEHLSSYIKSFYKNNLISGDKLTHYYDIYSKFKTRFMAKYPDATVNMYGSMAYGVCFTSTQCDIAVEFNKDNRTSQQTLSEVSSFISEHMKDCIKSNAEPVAKQDNKPTGATKSSTNKLSYKSKFMPTAVFNFTSGVSNEGYQTAVLLRAYLELDERAKLLTFLFRYMARIAQIDKSEYCFLPSHSYTIMVIYFLQRTSSPVLPVLHDLQHNTASSLKRTLKTSLSVDMNSILLSTSPSKKHIIKKKDRRISTNCGDLDLSVTESNEDESEKNFDSFRSSVQSFVNSGSWKSQNTECVGSLWLKLLSFYSLDFGFKKNLISIRQRKSLSKASVKMYTKKLSVEDPSSPRQSLSRNLSSMTNKYLTNVIRKTCVYFVFRTSGLPSSSSTSPTPSSSIIEQLSAETGIHVSDRGDEELSDEEIDSDVNNEDDESEQEDDDDDEDEEDDGEDTLSSEGSLSDELEIDEEETETDEHVMFTAESFDEEVFNEKKSLDPTTLLEGQLSSLILESQESTGETSNSLDQVENLLTASQIQSEVKACIKSLVDRVVSSMDSLTVPNLSISIEKVAGNKANDWFKFNITQIGISGSPPKICSNCNKDGHLYTECSQNQQLDLEDLPDMTDEWREVLTRVCMHIMDENSQTKEEELIRESLLQEIKEIVLVKFPKARLALFGSSNNGFAMKKSDMDICMTLDESPTEKEGLNYKKTIRTLGALFRYEKSRFDNIEERTSAKVPIVKFKHRRSNIEGDISLYNTLALYNTELLRSYVEIDKRTKTLGYVVKHFAKVCNIGDASCGTLSSYAYIIMMIHYLMNASPPVLPCLQELNRHTLSRDETNVIVDNWNCWFYRDLASLSSHWSGKNMQSIGELWIGFLRYYTETFDWNNNVVSIRSTAPLTRKTKNWTKHKLAIEDPFELSHNLAAGVSHKTGHYILTCFAKARKLFGMVKPSLRSKDVMNNMFYFFNMRDLVEGTLPMDRNCFFCSKIGHQTRECPQRRKLVTDKRKQMATKSESGTTNNNAVQSMSNSNSIQCFRCHGSGHKAKECPVVPILPRQKAVSVSIVNTTMNNNNTSSTICYNCQQMGHISRDCPVNYTQHQQMYVNSNQMANYNYNQYKIPSPQQQSQMRFQQNGGFNQHAQHHYMPNNHVHLHQQQQQQQHHHHQQQQRQNMYMYQQSGPHEYIGQQSAPAPKFINLNSLNMSNPQSVGAASTSANAAAAAAAVTQSSHPSTASSPNTTSPPQNNIMTSTNHHLFNNNNRNEQMLLAAAAGATAAYLQPKMHLAPLTVKNTIIEQNSVNSNSPCNNTSFNNSTTTFNGSGSSGFNSPASSTSSTCSSTINHSNFNPFFPVQYTPKQQHLVMMDPTCMMMMMSHYQQYQPPAQQQYPVHVIHYDNKSTINTSSATPSTLTITTKTLDEKQ